MTAAFSAYSNLLTSYSDIPSSVASIPAVTDLEW
jgi:hypothetical protein